MVPTTTVWWLVAVSVLTSIVSSYVAFSFAERLAASKGRAYGFWLTSGAVSMGLGIWSMHYIGMLAVRLPMDVGYHVPTVLVSLLLATLASAVALVVVSKERPSGAEILCGSVLMGSGIGTMHYVGMHAMRCAAMRDYDPMLVGLSVAIAVGFSWMAIWISCFVRSHAGGGWWLRGAGAVVMGCGIAAMHYTAMAAVTFERGGMAMEVAPENTVHTSTIGIAAIALSVGVVLFGALAATVRDRRAHEELRRANEGLERERDRFYAATESSMDSFFMCEAVRDEMGEIDDFVFTYLNSNVEKLVAIPAKALLGRRMCEVLPINRTLGLFDRYKQVVLTGEPLAYEFPIRHKDVLSSWVRVQAVKVQDGVAITASDITPRKLTEEQIVHIAHHDPLTGLLNRNLLRDRIGQAIVQARRNRTSAVVFFIDLDGFKRANDTMGHAAGDSLLVAVGRRLMDAVRSSDSVIRMGGDEFVVVMPGLTRASDAVLCAGLLLSSLQLPTCLGETPVTVTGSIGGAVYPETSEDVDALLFHADRALYEAKAAGKNRFHIYSESAAEPEASGDGAAAESGLGAMRV
ncbi:MAG: diguanylate cyclase [Acidobacteriaceae bacterium]